MPEPASRIISCWSEVNISTQEVLPPILIVLGPGVGIVPLTPQNLMRNGYLVDGLAWPNATFV
jgi:hypothetical protein